VNAANAAGGAGTPLPLPVDPRTVADRAGLRPHQVGSRQRLGVQGRPQGSALEEEGKGEEETEATTMVAVLPRLRPSVLLPW
jgi:hypothetical protein